MNRRSFIKFATGTTALAVFSSVYGLTKAVAGEMIEKVIKTNEEWKKILSPEQYRVLREHGTEKPNSSPLNHETREGTFLCAGCSLPVYSSKAKYDSGTGWPSFFEHLPGAIGTSEDRGFFSTRTEVHCLRCSGHLGHVFDDGPLPTSKRYCMNGVAMSFKPQ